MIIATPSGSIKGEGALPPVRGSSPTHPQSKEKRPKSAIFGDFFYFCPSESHFAPSMPATKKKQKTKNKKKKKKTGAATGHTIWWINRIPNVFLVVVL